MMLTLRYKILIFAAFLSCGLISCTKTDTLDNGFSVVKFNACFDNTKIVRDAEGKSIWEQGDMIDIYYDGGYTCASADSSGASATFTTEDAIPTDKGLYVAVYPSLVLQSGYDAELVDGELVITLKNNSYSSTFANCAICKASTTKAGGDLVFKNICSMLKYSSSNKYITEASLYTDNTTRYIYLTPDSESSESTYYSTLACGYKNDGCVHIDKLGLRLTSRRTGVDYPAYFKNVNRDFKDSYIYNLGNIEDKIFTEKNGGDEVSSLRLMSFNILRGDLQGPSHLWEGGTNPRKDACLAMITADKPDIINLQECTPLQRRDILNNFPQYGAVGLCVDGKYDNVDGVSSNSMIYNGHKLLVEDYGHYWFSDTPTKASNTWHAKKPRNLVWTRFKIKGSDRRFICISMHLQNDGDLYYDNGEKITDADDLKKYGEDNRVRSVNLILKKVLPSINTDGLPVILSGDCNCLITSTSLTNLQKKLNSAALLAPSGSSDTGNTFNGFVTGGKSRIDHIFSLYCNHLNYCVDRNSYAGTTFVSDHWPVYTDFTLTEPSSFDSNLEGWTQDDITI